MANELQSLSELFQNRLFRIPDYQRGYAWRHEQLADLWEDLLNLNEDRHHYTGLLSLKAVPKGEFKAQDGDDWLLNVGYKPYHVVDGQQRLTTFSILIYEIAKFIKNLPENANKSDDKILLNDECLKEIKEKYIARPTNNSVKAYMFGYETDNPSAEYLKHKVFEEPSGGAVLETYYTKNLKEAKNFFADNLKTLFQDEGVKGVERLYRKLTRRLMFHLHEIEDNYDVFVAFETINNRGKKLTNLERLKNRLIYLVTLFDGKQLSSEGKDKLRKDINDAWKEIYYQLGRNPKLPLSDDEFLQGHWITYFRYSLRGKNNYMEFLLKKFSPKNIFGKLAQRANDDDIFLSDTEADDDDDDTAGAETEVQFIGKLAPKDIISYVNNLKSLAKYWYFSRVPFDSNFSNDEKERIEKLNRILIGYFRPLVAAAISMEKTTEAERIALFKAIERFLFVSFRIGGTQSNYQRSVYYNKAYDLLNANASLSSITKGLNDTADKDMSSAIKSFSADIKKRFDDGNGFYGWKGLRYLLYEYECTKVAENAPPKVCWSMFSTEEKDKITIEHVLPQTPTKWYWKNTFRMYSDSEINQLCSSLGNLLLLSQSINSSLQNNSFEDKKNPTSAGHGGYVGGSYSAIEIAQEKDWTDQHILKRGLEILNFMEGRWGLKISDDLKTELLNISFVNDGHVVPPEIPEKGFTPIDLEIITQHPLHLDFWSNFVKYCKEKGREKDIASAKPSDNFYYGVPIKNRDYHIFFQIRKQALVIGVYGPKSKNFARLESLKTEIAASYDYQLEWHENAEAKWFSHALGADVRNKEFYPQCFEWFMNLFDKLKAVLDRIDPTE